MTAGPARSRSGQRGTRFVSFEQFPNHVQHGLLHAQGENIVTWRCDRRLLGRASTRGRPSRSTSSRSRGASAYSASRRSIPGSGVSNCSSGDQGQARSIAKPQDQLEHGPLDRILSIRRQPAAVVLQRRINQTAGQIVAPSANTASIKADCCWYCRNSVSLDRPAEKSANRRNVHARPRRTPAGAEILGQHRFVKITSHQVLADARLETGLCFDRRMSCGECLSQLVQQHAGRVDRLAGGLARGTVRNDDRGFVVLRPEDLAVDTRFVRRIACPEARPGWPRPAKSGCRVRLGRVSHTRRTEEC